MSENLSITSRMTSEILTLYELSSTVGSSTDLYENCKLFINTLVARKGLDFASIFIRVSELSPELKSDKFVSIFSTPIIYLKKGEINEDNYLLDGLDEKKFNIFDVQSFSSIKLFDLNYFNKGKMVIFSLGRIGFLFLQSVKPELNLTKIHIKQMENIINILTTSIKGNLSMIRLNRKNQELEKLMEEQKALIKNIQIINEDLEQFAYVASHDLREPLRGITRISQWLMEDYSCVLDDNGKKLLTLMNDRVQRMDNLIKGILDYSRVELIQQNLVQINLIDLVDNVIELLVLPDNIIISKDIKLESIYFERTKLIQMFHNLLGNSIKHNDKERVEINICIEEYKGTIIIKIKDNGPGIPKVHHERIFKIFQTLDKKKGAGIGLSIVKKIVQFYKGSIQLESIEGEGAEFTILLPLLFPEEGE